MSPAENGIADRPGTPPGPLLDLAPLRTDRLLLGLLVGVVVLRLFLYAGVAGAPLVGDEWAYVNGGRALSNLVRDVVSLHAPDGAELSTNVVGSGWFMPGMSLLLTPLFVVVPEAPMWLVRGYLGLAGSGLLLLVVLDVRRTLGRVPALALLVFPGLVPMYAIFSMAAWGDTLAGLVVVLLLCAVVRLLRTVRAGGAPTLRDGVVVGLLAITATYLRSSASLLAGGVLVAVALLALLMAHRTRRRAVLAASAAALVTFVVVLAPWSATASHVLGGRVVTTTSVPTVLGNTFGDPELLCYGPCDPGSTPWFTPLRYAREVARATGVGEVEVLGQMSQYARRDVTPRSYADDVVANARNYAAEPGRFARYVRWDAGPYGVERFTSVGTGLFGWPATAVTVLLLLVVVRRRVDLQVQSVLLKLMVGALLTQPFVHLSGARYWTTLAPLLALGVGLLAAEVASRRAVVADGADDGPAEPEALRRVLVAAQVVLAAGVVLVVGVVAVLAA